MATLFFHLWVVPAQLEEVVNEHPLSPDLDIPVVYPWAPLFPHQLAGTMDDSPIDELDLQGPIAAVNVVPISYSFLFPRESRWERLKRRLGTFICNLRDVTWSYFYSLWSHAKSLVESASSINE